MSPLTITIMLECYTCAIPGTNVPPNIWDSDAARDVRAHLHSEKLIDRNFRATARGRAWVEFLIETPFPVCTWKLPTQGEDP